MFRSHVALVRLLTPLILLGSSVALAQPTLPSGWRSAPAAAVGIERAFEATALPVGEYLTIQQGLLRALRGATIDGWLAAVVAAEPAPSGRWVTTARPSNVTDGVMATVAREFLTPAGTRGGRIFVAVAGGNGEARLLTLTFSSAKVLKSAQGTAARTLMSEIATQTLDGRRRSTQAERTPSRAADANGNANVDAIASSPPSRNGLRVGGALVPGRYAGALVNNDGKTIARYDVTLFENGEYAAPSGDNLLDSTGTYVYDAGTGRLDVDGKMVNNRYSPDKDFCYFARDARGNPVIYFEDYYGVGTFRALLRRLGDPSREPPSVVLAVRKAAEAEAARYKFVTAPDAGLRDADIEGVYYEWNQVYEIGGLQFKEGVYLLLKDGTVRQGLPVPPQDLDVALSKQREPEVWGRWRMSGANYEFAFGAGGRFARKQGYLVSAAGADANLVGTYEGASSFQIPGGAGAWAKFGVTFQPGGRFETFRVGGAGMSSGGGDQAVVTATVYDDDGVVGGVSSGTVSGGSSRRTPDTGNRRGTYRVEHYAIILSYANGRVDRLPFVIQQEPTGRVKGVWMMGSLLSPPKK